MMPELALVLATIIAFFFLLLLVYLLLIMMVQRGAFLNIKDEKSSRKPTGLICREHNHNISSWQKARRENIKDALRSVTDSPIFYNQI